MISAREHCAGLFCLVAVAAEREDEGDEEHSPAASEVADGDGDSEVNEASANEAASHEDTAADHERMQQTLTELQNLGTLDPRDAVWLSALLKGGASAAQQRRSDADVFEYAQQRIESMTKSKGKRPALATLERQVSTQFKLSDKHKTHIRKMLTSGEGRSLIHCRHHLTRQPIITRIGTGGEQTDQSSVDLLGPLVDMVSTPPVCAMNCTVTLHVV